MGNPYHDRLDHLLVTAARVFAEKGYHPTTMRDLARETGMSLAGMYHYVSGKEELLYRIQERCFTQVIDGAETVLAKPGTADDRLARFIEHHVTFFARHMSEMKVLSHEGRSLGGERIAGMNRLKRRYVTLLTDLVRAVAEPAGRGSGPHPSVAAFALFGMMNWIYTWYDPTGAVSPEALGRQFGRLFIHGLAVPDTTPVAQGG